MQALAVQVVPRLRTETLLAASLAAVSAVAVALLAPPGGDSAAHLYRTMLVRDGVHLWDNLWYGGHYPLASYSLLYYLPADLVGNVPLVVAAVIASAALFASLAEREWGDVARWPARLFGVFAAGPLFTGTYSYAVGLAAALAALWLLQRARPWAAGGCAALALGFSPLAFVFLGVALLAVLAARRRVGREGIVVAGVMAALAVLQLGVLVAFPTSGRYPFSWVSLLGVVSVTALGSALALRSPRARELGAFFALWGLVNLAAFFVASPFGDNLTRLRAVVFPLVLLAALLVGLRPRALAAAALAVALVYNVAPDVSALPKRAEDARTADAAFWRPAIAFLRTRSGPGYRVEVVPTFGHWEAYWLPRAGFALARGWYRQIDLAHNPVLYRKPLDPEGYRAWLRRMGVRFVLLPHARLGARGADREARLLRSRASGLRPVFRSESWTIYELPRATPILSGPAPARLDRLGHERIAGWTSRRGMYRLRVRYTRYWRVAAGGVCVRSTPDGMTELVARRPGRFLLTLPGDPSALVRGALGRGGGEC